MHIRIHLHMDQEQDGHSMDFLKDVILRSNCSLFLQNEIQPFKKG